MDLKAKSFKTIIGGTVNNNKERRQGDITQNSFKTVEKVLKKLIATQLREKKYADIKLLKPQFIKRETKKEKRSRDIDGGVQGLHNDQDFTKDEQFDPKAFSFWAPLQKSALVDFLVHPDPNPENEDSSIFQRLTVQIPVGYGVLHNAWHGGSDNVKMSRLEGEDEESLRFFAYVNADPGSIFSHLELRNFVKRIGNNAAATKQLIKSQTPSFTKFVEYVRHAVGNKKWLPNSSTFVDLTTL